MPGHRVLAMLRGENEGFLKLKIRPPEEKALSLLLRHFVKGDRGCLGTGRHGFRGRPCETAGTLYRDRHPPDG